MNQQLKIWLWSCLPRLVAAGMLIGALDKHAYGYFTLLRWVVCGAAAYLTYVAIETEKVEGAWVFGIMALLFNPIIPIHLSRSLWMPLDVVSALLFIASIFWIKPPQEKTPDEDST